MHGLHNLIDSGVAPLSHYARSRSKRRGLVVAPDLGSRLGRLTVVQNRPKQSAVGFEVPVGLVVAVQCPQHKDTDEETEDSAVDVAADVMRHEDVYR